MDSSYSVIQCWVRCQHGLLRNTLLYVERMGYSGIRNTLLYVEKMGYSGQWCAPHTQYSRYAASHCTWQVTRWSCSRTSHILERAPVLIHKHRRYILANPTIRLTQSVSDSSWPVMTSLGTLHNGIENDSNLEAVLGCFQSPTSFYFHLHCTEWLNLAWQKMSCTNYQDQLQDCKIDQTNKPKKGEGELGWGDKISRKRWFAPPPPSLVLV